MTEIKTAVLITCYNRKKETLACLEGLSGQKLPEGIKVHIFLVDDGSSDGTEEEIRNTYPEVTLIKGDGSLYWNGGMRLAFSKALEYDYDYYLWLNDDVRLYDDALDRLLKTSKQLNSEGYSTAIIAGSTCDSLTGKITYGGVIASPLWWEPLKHRLIKPDEKKPLPCHTMTGNCVLIPREVARLTGNLDESFTHYMGDTDYGLRNRMKGGTVWIAPGYMGTCSQNSDFILRGNLSFKTLLKNINHPKAYPLKEWEVYIKRHKGRFWPLYLILPYIKLIFRSLSYEITNFLGKG
ncbi:MAG TPA: glycosyltransferase family 2 protein [Candidatus Eremiobacteraeota bacterium]|nr:MAG: N-acetylglucosaminyl-diphospho-decaprenol L-rhamnosyltransferase [bacterium ADurb.Bin363]HPZ07616.1 glycosyltransferase family 2 protein [Candidatus Eremiobacteraeota bacterium]